MHTNSLVNIQYRVKCERRGH